MGLDRSHVSIDEVSTPEIKAFIAYWQSLRGERFAPSWAEFDLIELPAPAIPNIVVVDVVPNPLDFIIRFWGTGHVLRKGVDKTGQSVNAPPEFRGETAFAEYKWVIERKEPLASRDVVELQEKSNRLPFEQRLVRLPLSNDDAAVNHVVSLAVWDNL